MSNTLSTPVFKRAAASSIDVLPADAPHVMTPVWSPATRLLVVEFPEAQSSLSWALGFGGFREVPGVAWCEVKNQELGLDVDPEQLLRDRLAAVGKAGWLGMLTSARVECFGQARVEHQDVAAEAIATVGFGNAVCVGELLGGPASLPRAGTINIACWSSVPLGQDAHTEALSIATEARTRAVMEARIVLGESQLVATGTGTDCLAILSPRSGATGNVAQARYAGKHTDIGYTLGAACYRAVNQAMARVQAAARLNAGTHG